MFFSRAFPVFAAFVTFAYGTQTKTTCADGLCFETTSLELDGAEVSLGIAMPSHNDGEFLVNASIPLPYGFLSMTLGRDYYCSKHMVLFVDEVVEAGPNFPPLNMSHVRAQLSSFEDDRLEPFGNATSTISHLTSRTSDRVNIVARVQAPQVEMEPFFTANAPELYMTFSLNSPEYLDSENQKAELYLNGSHPKSFVFSGVGARFGNYSQMVKAAGCY